MTSRKIEGIIFLYVALQGLSMILLQSTTGESSIWGVLDSLWRCEYETNVSVTAISAIFAPAGAILAFLVAFGKAALFYYPAIFQGIYTWIYFLFFLGIAAAVIWAVIGMIRGVSST